MKAIGLSSLIFCMAFGLTNSAVAQEFEVQGQVIDSENDNPIPGANIIEVGTQNGATTNPDGEFTIRVSDSDASIRISFIGYTPQTVTLEGRTNITVELQYQTEGLEGVVVTALGLERESKSLGYSVSEVGATDLVSATETNFANLLQGQVAGVNVSSSSGGPGSSSRVIIRGASSLDGNNQPLYVVDGVPIDNTNIGASGMWGGFDGGDGISKINSEDIESISVLKGASAAALYGTRARDGVVQITTKSGRGLNEGPVVNFNSTVTLEDALTNFSDYQNQYGQGNLGQKPQNQQEALATGLSSWGAPLDGSSVIQFDGQQRSYSDQGDQLDNFYRTGVSSKNTLSLAGGSESSSYYFSATRQDAQSIVPESDLDRTSLTLRGSHIFGNLTADVKANYINEGASNRPSLSDSPGNANFAVASLPRNLNLSVIEANHVALDGSEGVYQNSNTFVTNPYWVTNKFNVSDNTDRIIGHVNLDYNIADWISLSGRTGLDQYTLRRTNVLPWGTAYNSSGALSENEYRISESTTDILLHLDRQITSSIGANAVFGGSRSHASNEQVGLNGSVYKVPEFTTISNMENLLPNYGFSERQINSLYGSVDLDYNDFLFVTVTGRNDWSSTLPSGGNHFFYPSLSTSFVFSDLFEVPEWLSLGRVRASWAEVGNDTDPYQLNLTYSILSFTHQEQSVAAIAQDQIPLADLKPTATVEVELGFDLRFLDDRISADFTWYDRQTTNQILATTVSHTTGFGNRVINAGRLDNTGIEVLLKAVPISTTDTFWETSVNYGRNKSEVAELSGEQETLVLDESRTQNAFVTATVGEEYGTIRGFTYVRDDNGDIVHENGLPVQSEGQSVLGKGTPDWVAGWSNTFSHKDFSLNLLIDAQWGGQIYSATNSYAYGFGLHENTLPGRSECDQAGVPYSPCFVADGVDVGGGSNETAVTPAAYYSNIASNITEEFVYDANFIKLRQLQLTYSLPESVISSIPVRSASVSLTGRNLFYLYDPVPNIDPEAAINSGNAQGLELAGVPAARTFGLGINLGF